MKREDNITEIIKHLTEYDSENAFKQLYLHYYDRLISYSLFYVHNEYDAEEVVSDSFYYIWKTRNKLPSVDNFESFLFRIVRNKSIDKFNHINHDLVKLDALKYDLSDTTTQIPDNYLISKETVERIDKAIQELPPKCRIAFKLIREDKLKYNDAASLLKISVKTLESHITLALKKLRENLIVQKKEEK